jgi:hypothetical protein
MKASFTFLFTILITAISYPQGYLDLLVKWMTGPFSSEEQAKLDTNYFDIELEMV